MPKISPEPNGSSPATSALMYCTALLAGVVLVVFGRSTAVEASGYVSPFLVVFQEMRRRR